LAEYTTGLPSQSLRLRNWPAGRINTLRLAVQRLELEVNRGLGSRVQQSRRRRISDQVPFPLNLEAKPGFRQVEINIGAAPGLGGHPRRQLLFYEIHHDSSPAFPDPTIIETAQTHIVLGGLALGEIRSFRARVINTYNDASVWTETRTVRVAQSQIQQTGLPDADVRLLHPVGSFQTIMEATYQPVEAMASINAHIAVLGPHFDITQTRSGVTRDIFRGGPATVQCRWRIGVFNEETQTFQVAETGQRALFSVRPGYSPASTNAQRAAARNPLAFGTMMTPWYKLPAGSLAQVQLQAAKCPGSEWLGAQRERGILTTDPVVFMRGGQVIEVLEDA